MRKPQQLKWGLALGSLTAAVALLAGVPAASAQTAPGAGSFPGSFLVPGTNTSLKIGGYVKGDLVKDFSAKSTSSSVPMNLITGRAPHGNVQISAKESRLNFETRTPTSYGDLKTYIEFDFFGGEGSALNNSSHRPRLRHAYGTLGPLLIGQTWSLFDDVRAGPEELDFGGNVASWMARTPQFRYTYVGPSGVSFAVALQDPETLFSTTTGGFETNNNNDATSGGANRWPDAVIEASLDQAWGHVSVAAELESLDVNTTVATHHSELGYATRFSGHLNTFGKDNLKWGLTYGQGGNRTISQLASASTGGGPALELNDTGSIAQVVPFYAGFAGYQHWWTTELRSNVVGGYLRQINSSVAPGTANHRDWDLHVNLIWSPVPQVDLGVEYLRRRQVIEDGRHGTIDRIQIAGKFKF